MTAFPMWKILFSHHQRLLLNYHLQPPWLFPRLTCVEHVLESSTEFVSGCVLLYMEGNFFSFQLGDDGLFIVGAGTKEVFYNPKIEELYRPEVRKVKYLWLFPISSNNNHVLGWATEFKVSINSPCTEKHANWYWTCLPLFSRLFFMI